MCTVSIKEGQNLPQQHKKRCGKCLESQPTEQKQKNALPTKMIEKIQNLGTKIGWLLTIPLLKTLLFYLQKLLVDQLC